MITPGFYTINLFVHLVAVSLWLGMTLMFSLMVVPLLRDLPRTNAEDHLETIGKRARRIVLILISVLILTGLINLHRFQLLKFSKAWGSAYGITAAIKIALAFLLFAAFPVIFVLVHRHGKDDLQSRIDRMNYLHWGISLVTLVIMFLGVLLRS